jgi:hypothetical protein
MNATTTTARKKKFIFLAASAFLMVAVGTVLLGVLLTQALPDGGMVTKSFAFLISNLQLL